ncbi:MAG TPA: FAD-dependent oxidoreductase [Polyangiaceae bacterium]|nr:FAD-dependent oxidoreductase [Polyangiaceae bacterium]
MARRRKAELVHARMLSASVRSLTLRTTDRSPVGHLAGQYLDVIVPTPRGLPYKRSYSIASAPDDQAPWTFELAVTRVEGGPTSDALHAMAPGDVVEIEGPAGAFVRRAPERGAPALLVATGTGLAPIRAMLAEEVRDRAGPPLLLLFGCRTPADVLWGDELRAWQRECPRFALHVTLSRAPPEWTGLVGYVQRHARALAESLPGVHAYVCGLSAMVDDVVRILERDAGLERRALHYETYD